MKRKMSKMMAVTMAAMMACALPVFAEEGTADAAAETAVSGEGTTDPETVPDTEDAESNIADPVTNLGSITVKGNKAQTLKGKTFTAYEMFTLTYVNTGEKDENPDDDYAYQLKAEWKDLFLKTLGLSIPEGETADSVAYQYVSGLGSNTEEINLFTKTAYDYAAEKKIEGKTGSPAGSASYQIPDLEDGYYLVFETVTEENGTLSKGILSTVVVEVGGEDQAGNSSVKNVVVTQKADIPEHDKQILHDEENSWGIVGDNAIGDIVDYRIIKTVPDTFGYEDYSYIIHDYMEKGLTLNSQSIRLYSDEEKTQEIDPSGYQVTLGENLADGCDFEVSVSRDTLDELYKNGMAKIYTYYDCILNEEAEIASEHNDNTSYLEYSCNPYVKEDHSKTTEVTVYDYTFVLNGLKINAEGNALKDAKFQILKDGKALSLLTDDGNHYFVEGVLKEEETQGMKQTDTIVTGLDGKIDIYGLNDSISYTLRETVAPAGYTRAADTEFTIKAAYDETGKLEKTETNNETITIDSHRLNTKIVDNAQPPLPVTGGKTTLVLYGSAMAAALCGIGMVGAGKKKKEEK